MLKSKEKESELRQFKEKYEKDMQSMREEIKDDIKEHVSKIVSLIETGNCQRSIDPIIVDTNGEKLNEETNN